MTTDRDLDRLLDRWFAQREIRAEGRVIDIVVGRIEHERQLPAWRVSWRDSPMHAYVKPLAAIAAVIAIAVVGYNLLPRSSPGVGGLGPTSSPTASPTPSPTATATASPAPTATAAQGPTTLSDGELQAGTYETQPFAGTAISLTFRMPGGWKGFQSWGLIGPGPNGTGTPDGIGVGFSMASALYGDPCRWDAGRWGFPAPGDIAVGPTVDDLVAALQANRAYVASAPAEVTVDGYAGKQLALQLPADVDAATCGQVMGSPGILVWAPPTDAQGRPAGCCVMAGPLALGPGSRWDLRILDVEGTRAIIVVGDYAGTPAADRAAAQAIVDSIQIAP